VLAQSRQQICIALTNVARHDTGIDRTSASAARAHKHSIGVKEAQARVTPQSKPAKEGSEEQKAETQDHADEHVCGDPRVYCGKEDDASNVDERGKCKHVLEAAEQRAQMGKLRGSCHCR
jgi:hypothetical protein